MQDALLSNKLILGAFGEFVYERHCRHQGLRIEATNLCHTDFIVSAPDFAWSRYVDVRTTIQQPRRYRGTRYDSEIAYEMLCIDGDCVHLLPDHHSPFQDQHIRMADSLASLLAEWGDAAVRPLRKPQRISDNTRAQLRAALSGTRYRKIRFLERGPVGRDRSTGGTDNFPGSNRQLLGYDATILFQFDCQRFSEIIDEIVFLPHHLVVSGEIELAQQLSRRRSGKGVRRTLDLAKFRQAHPGLFFCSIEELFAALGSPESRE